MQGDTHFRNKASALSWLIWGLAAAYFLCDYFARVSPSVMAEYLVHDFNITAVGLGSLSAFFYYPYLAMQVPVGLLVDRFSIRALLTIMTIITALGCILFGLAPGLTLAATGRFLIGFSAAFAFVSALKLAADWFPPAMLGLLAGMTQAAGMLGAAIGDAPVSLSVQALGWRHTMFIMGAIFVVLGIIIFLIVRDHPRAAKNITDKAKQSLSVLGSLKKILSNPQTWWNALYAGMVYAPTAAFAELWGVFYLEHGHGLSIEQAAFANGMIFIGWAFGGPLFGIISDKIGRRRPLMFFSPLAGMLILLVILLDSHLSAMAIYGLLFLFGVTNAGVSIAYAVATEINPQPVVGASIAFTNMSSVVPGALLQIVIGKLIDLFAGGAMTTPMSQQLSQHLFIPMLVLPLCSFLGIVCAFFVKETRCRPVVQI